MGGSNGHRRQLFPCARPARPDTNRRRSSRHLRLLVRVTRRIPISASPPLGHPEDLGVVGTRTHSQRTRMYWAPGVQSKFSDAKTMASLDDSPFEIFELKKPPNWERQETSLPSSTT